MDGYIIRYHIKDGDGVTVWTTPLAMIAIAIAHRMVWDEVLHLRETYIFHNTLKGTATIGAVNPDGTLSPSYTIEEVIHAS